MASQQDNNNSNSKIPGPHGVPAVDPLGASHGPPGAEDHPQDHHDAEQDEGAGPQGEELKVAAGERARHGRRLQVTQTKKNLQ